jgi:hypothetical protein
MGCALTSVLAAAPVFSSRPYLREIVTRSERFNCAVT